MRTGRREYTQNANPKDYGYNPRAKSLGDKLKELGIRYDGKGVGEEGEKNGRKEREKAKARPCLLTAT